MKANFSKIQWPYLAVLLIGIAIGFYASLRWPAPTAFAKLVTIESRGLSFDVVTAAPDVAGLLAEQKVPLADIVIAPALNEELSSGMVITYRTPVSVIIVDGGSVSRLNSAAETVKDALDSRQIVLASQDELSPPLDFKVYNNLSITIQRIEESEEVQVEPVPYGTETRGDPELLYGVEREVSPGKNGKREVRYFVRYKNGKEIFRKKLSEQVIDRPVSRIVSAGRKIAVESYEFGQASWYAYKKCLCAAHPFFAKGSFLRVTALASGQSIIVTVNDTGPNQRAHPDRVIDLDAEAFKQLASLAAGTVEVKVEKLQSE